jgi:hypothetical protein
MHPCIAPSGQFRSNLPVLGAAEGKGTQPFLKVSSGNQAPAWLPEAKFHSFLASSLIMRKGFCPPYAAPSTGAFVRNCPQGCGRDAARFSQGLGCPFEKPLTKVPARRINATWGGFFFGYFLLAKQKKVPRLSGRDPTSKTKQSR